MNWRCKRGETRRRELRIYKLSIAVLLKLVFQLSSPNNCACVGAFLSPSFVFYVFTFLKSCSCLRARISRPQHFWGFVTHCFNIYAASARMMFFPCVSSCFLFLFFFLHSSSFENINCRRAGFTMFARPCVSTVRLLNQARRNFAM